MTLSPQTLGQKVWELLGIQKGDEVVISRDTLSDSILISRERKAST